MSLFRGPKPAECATPFPPFAGLKKNEVIECVLVRVTRSRVRQFGRRHHKPEAPVEDEARPAALRGQPPEANDFLLGIQARLMAFARSMW